MAALPAQYLSGAFDSGTMYETPGMPPVYSTPSMLSLPINNQLGGNVMMWPYARAGGAGANVGAAYKVPLQTSVHHDPDANRTDYKRLQLNTTIQNQWVTARGTVANGETMQATSLQGIYAPTPWVQAGPSYAAAPGAAYYQPAHQYANYQPAVSYANSAAAPNSGRIVRLPPQSQQSNNGMRY